MKTATMDRGGGGGGGGGRGLCEPLIFHDDNNISQLHDEEDAFIGTEQQEQEQEQEQQQAGQQQQNLNDNDDDTDEIDTGICGCLSSYVCCCGCFSCCRGDDRSGDELSLTTSYRSSLCRCLQLYIGNIANLCSATLGAGILSLPFAFYQSGVLAGIALMVGSALATNRSIYLLTTSMDYYINCTKSRRRLHSYTNLLGMEEQEQTQPRPPEDEDVLTTMATAFGGRRSFNHNRPHPVHDRGRSISSSSGPPLQPITSREDIVGLSDTNDDQLPTANHETTIDDTTITYEELVEALLGYKVRKFIEINIIIFCVGCSIAYIITIQDILQQVLPHHTSSCILELIIVWAGIMVPLSLLKTMKGLQCSSSVGVASIITLLVAAVYHLLVLHNNTQEDTTTTLLLGGRWMDTTNSTTIYPIKNYLYPADGIKSIVIACPIILFAFSCQVNVAAIYSELVDDYEEDESTRRSNATNRRIRCKTTKQQKMSIITYFDVIICCLLYTSISIVSLLDFGKTIQPNLLSSYESHSSSSTATTNTSSIMEVAFYGMALAVIMAFPLNIFPARNSLQGLLFTPKNTAPTTANNNNNTTTNNNTNPLEEPLLIIDDNDDNDANIANENNVTENHPTTTTSTTTTNEITMSSSSSSTLLSSMLPTKDSFFVQHVVLTLALTSVALGFAIITPNISTIFGLLGGTTSSVLGFIIPGILGLQTISTSTSSTNGTCKSRMEYYCFKCSSWLLIIGGILVGIVTTGVTLYDTFF